MGAIAGMATGIAVVVAIALVQGWRARRVRVRVVAPDGTSWRLGLERAIATPRGVVRRLRQERPPTLGGWLEDHPPGWILTARPAQSESRHMWITPAKTETEAIRDLQMLASHIAAGKALDEFGTG